MGILAGLSTFVKKKYLLWPKSRYFIKAWTKRVGVNKHDRAYSFLRGLHFNWTLIELYSWSYNLTWSSLRLELDVENVREKCHVTCTLDSLCKILLIAEARTRVVTRDDTIEFRKEFLEESCILIVDASNSRFFDRAYFLLFIAFLSCHKMRS